MLDDDNEDDNDDVEGNEDKDEAEEEITVVVDVVDVVEEGLELVTTEVVGFDDEAHDITEGSVTPCAEQSSWAKVMVAVE